MGIIIALVTSLITHFTLFGYPSAVVFDEVHNGNFLTNYWQGTYFFDVHPPLAKLIEAVFGYLTGANHVVADFGLIGNTLSLQVVLLRLLPLIAGIVLPFIIYAILRKLQVSKTASSMIAILLCLENSLIVQSRFIIFDVIMLCFGFLAILFYLEFESRPKNRLGYLFLAASAVCAASATSIKWTGLAFLLIIILLELYRQVTENKLWFSKTLKRAGTLTGIYIAIGLFVYVTLFAIHLALLPKSGPGDPFMTSAFQATLKGNHIITTTALVKPGFFGKFFELNAEMYRANLTLTVAHPYSSKWYTWPFMKRPIFYWQGSSTGPIRNYIYLLGNPFLYWSGSIGILTLIIYGLSNLSRKKLHQNDQKRKKLLFLLTFGYLVNFLPFIFIGRVMFLYHYEAALIFSIMSLAFFVDLVPEKKRVAAAAIIVSITLAAFIYWCPLTYGLPLNDQQLAARLWLPTWR